jgi:tetratricopeptide (TPR) repeat protein
MARTNLGNLLADQGRFLDAIAQYRKALESRPDDAEIFYNLGNAFAGRGQLDEATANFRQALAIKPDYAEAHDNLAAALTRLGRLDEALAHYRQALQILPDYPVTHCNMGLLLAGRGQFGEALEHYRQALKIQPDYAQAHNNLAWLWATCPEASRRQGAAAIEHAERANKLGGGRQPDVLDTLAAAYAEAGRFPEAVATARNALKLARQQNDQALLEGLRSRLALYEAGEPYHETPSASPPAPSKP